MSPVLRIAARTRGRRVLRLIGLDMKLKQYDGGAAFIKAVEHQADLATVTWRWGPRGCSRPLRRSSIPGNG